MDNQTTHGQKDVRNLTTGNWITIIAGCLFIISLFLNWESTGGFLYAKGIGFILILKIGRLYNPFFLTVLAVIGCTLLSIPILKKRGKRKIIPTTRIVLAILGLLPFGVLPFISICMPKCQYEFGYWLAVLAVFGLLTGAILSFNED